MSMFATPEGKAKAEADYAEAVAKIDAAVAECRYCKAAKTRKLNALQRRGQLWAVENESKHRQLTITALFDTECDKHRNAYRLAYVCSPVSETYWAS